ncbi:Probable polygalacturonase [Linum perenne]
MKMPVNNKMRLSMVALLLLLALSFSVNGEEGGEWSNGRCDHKPSLQPRPHSVSILEFGAVGDGKSLNTLAFQNAIFYLKSFADKGGAQLYVPTGKWLTGSFNLTSHLTLFLSKNAVILGSQTGIEFRTTKGRGGYIKHVAISDIELVNITTAFSARGDVGIHPDEEFDPQALPTIEGISFSDVVGSNVTLAGNFTGIEESPFTSICMLNVTLTPDPSWVCSNVDGFSDSVSPTPCPQLSSPVTGSSSCYTAVVVDSYGQSASL